MFKTLFFATLLTALIPFIHVAQDTAAGYQHMQKTVFAMSDSLVLRDYDRFASCAAAAQAEGNALAGADGTRHHIDANPSKCQSGASGTSGEQWVAVR